MAKLILFNLAILLVITLVKSQAGAPVDIPVTSRKVRMLVNIFNSIDANEQIISVYSAKKQVVAGTKYFLNVFTTQDFDCVLTFWEKLNGEIVIEKRQCQEKKKA